MSDPCAVQRANLASITASVNVYLAIPANKRTTKQIDALAKDLATQSADRDALNACIAAHPGAAPPPATTPPPVTTPPPPATTGTQVGTGGRMTPAAFAAKYLPFARRVQTATGIDAWALVTQWALETEFASSYAAMTCNNMAGIEHPGPSPCAPYWSYSSLEAFVADAIAVFGLGYYTGVLAVTGQGTVATLYALGQSPWAGSHYGSPPGSNLVVWWNDYFAPLAGQPAATANPTSLFAPIYVAAVQLVSAIGQTFPAAPWAASQGLAGYHLGSVPSLEAGANYLAGALRDEAITARGSYANGNPNAVIGNPATVPTGATDPTVVLAPVYVGLDDLAHALGTGLLGVPWGSGVAADHFGNPPSLDAGSAFLSGQLSGLLGYVQSGVPPTAPPPGGGPPGVTPPPVTPPGGTGVLPPLPPPLSPPGPGVAGLLGAWDQLRTEINTTLPGLASRIDAAIAAIRHG